MNSLMVSVIMPAFNSGKYIQKAIQSVLMQEVSLELIIINDCSTDNLEQIINPYLSDVRVIYIKNQKNLGVAKSRNIGMEMARGKYIAFLDSDDWWLDGKLKKQVDILERTDYVICTTARELVSGNGKSLGKIIPVSREIKYKDLLFHNSINCSSVLIRSNVAKKHPMLHDDSHEDYIMWLKVLKEHGSAYGLNEPLLMYRLSEEGKSRNKLKSAKMTFKVYRYMNFGTGKSVFYFLSYMIHGLKKYM